jgi:hypothetical protein
MKLLSPIRIPIIHVLALERYGNRINGLVSEVSWHSLCIGPLSPSQTSALRQKY